jgi:hypothetical protein
VSGRIFAVLGVTVLLTACGPGAFVPPAGPGEPAPDAAVAWTEAIAACRDVRTYSASLRLSGRSADQRLPGVGAIVALTAQGSIFLQIVGGNRPVLTLAGTADQATYFLHEDHRVVTARAGEIVETIVGVPISPEQLLAILSGCAVRQFDVQRAARFGKRLAVTTADGQVFLERRTGPWETAAAIVGHLTVQFARKDSRFPTSLRLDATPPGGPGSWINISAIDQLDINTDLAPAVFAPPAAAASAAPMTLEELRAAGPFGRTKNSVKLEAGSQKLEVIGRLLQRPSSAVGPAYRHF